MHDYAKVMGDDLAKQPLHIAKTVDPITLAKSIKDKMSFTLGGLVHTIRLPTPLTHRPGMTNRIRLAQVPFYEFIQQVCNISGL